MSAEILMNVTPQESRVAILENGVLQELIIERNSSRGKVSNIYQGTVHRILPGMEAAFIDIGLDKKAFLHASDLRFTPSEVFNGDTPNEEISYPPIAELLHVGKKVLVQVIKDPIGTKGARLTMHITIPSRYLVFMPDTDSIGVSSKIEEEEERTRLKELVAGLRDQFNESNPNSSNKMHGFIVRTVAEGINEEALYADMMFLCKLWHGVIEDNKTSTKGVVMYSDLPLTQRVLRDVVGEKIEVIKVDSRENYLNLIQFCKTYIPELADRIEHYPLTERPIFDLHGVEDEIQKSLKRKVQLKSGGYLIIDQTEAMTTIDVNTGGFIGHRNLEETIFKTNLEAAQTTARQLRLRNLGGIIIIDFIDMHEEEHKQEVLTALEKALENDHAKTSVSDVSSLGLVEMTRKRTRESLEHVLCESCPSCEGRGYVKTATTVCYEIFREISREYRQFNARELLVLASQEVIELLLDEESDSFAELQEFIGVPIRLQGEGLYSQEQFDVVLV